MYKRLLTLIAVLMLAGLQTAQAREGQFFFIAHKAPRASITATSQSGEAVYLRWDVIDSRLPADIVSFRLYRNGQKLADLPAQSVMPVQDIRNLYIGEEQRRRKLETLHRLAELSASRGDNFDPAGFAAYLHSLIDPQSPGYNFLWAYVGSRTDFNIARARHHAWLDTTAPYALNRYELQAVDAQGRTARIGHVEIDTRNPVAVQGASNLRQVLNQDANCDLPESGKDDYSLRLTWDSPGQGGNSASITDRFAAQFALAGYDLYRSSSNLDAAVSTAPVIDIAAISALASTNNRGEPSLPGLEKVNSSLLMDAGENDEGFKWMEDRSRLKRAGIRPGDRRAYYLVARDFTGNYGPTTAVIVEIPEMARPPAPWNLRSLVDTSSSILTPGKQDALLLSWDRIDLDSYVEKYKHYYRFCNIAEAAQTGVLEFVTLEQSCVKDAHAKVRVDVSDYRVYRFASFDEASRFKDSDGDGVADSVERPHAMQCDASRQPPGATGYLVPATDVEFISDQNRPLGTLPVISMRDLDPARKPGQVYWYRVAALAGSQSRPSYLSAPQRAIFRDHNPPAAPQVTVTRPGKVPGCRLDATPGGSWQLSESISPPGQKAANFTLRCNSTVLNTSLTATAIGTATTSYCQNQVPAQCSPGDTVSIDFNDPALNCSLTLPAGVDLCSSGTVSIVPTTVDAQVPAHPGDLVSGSLSIDVLQTVAGKTCVALYEYIEGTATRVDFSCDAAGLSYQPGSRNFCGYAVTIDENNNISSTVHFPCTLATDSRLKLLPPQILDFRVAETQEYFSFRLPSEKTSVTIARLEHRVPGEESRFQRFSIPVQAYEAGVSINHSTPVVSLSGEEDSFCLSLQALTRLADGTAITSKWSKKRCYTRSNSSDALPQYLPWPQVQSPARGDDLQLRLGTDFANVGDYLSFDILALDAGSVHCNHLPDIPGGKFDSIRCNSAGLADTRAALQPQLNFIVYRQSRDTRGRLTDWVAVSPLIDYVHFDVDKSLKNVNFWELRDPFIKVRYDNGNNRFHFFFLDNYPYMLNAADGVSRYEYRYQVVYFDERHQPVLWRQSNWAGGTP